MWGKLLSNENNVLFIYVVDIRYQHYPQSPHVWHKYYVLKKVNFDGWILSIYKKLDLHFVNLFLLIWPSFIDI